MEKSREISDYEIIKGCAEYLQISEADIVSDEYMREHPNDLDILVNVAICCKEKPRREDMVTHRQMVVHKLECNDIDYSTRYNAEKRTRDKILKDKIIKSQGLAIVEFIASQDYMACDFEVIDSKIVGYHGRNKDIVIPKGVQLGERAFSNCTTIESITLNEDIKEIPWCAFADCKNLISIFGLESVERIGRNAFFGCESLEKITLPLGLEEIDDHTFYGCAALKEVIIPESVVEIG